MRPFRGNPAKWRAANIKAERFRRRHEPATRRSFAVDPLTRRFVRPLLIALMATAFAGSLLVIVTIGTPEKSWYWLTPYVLVVAMAGAYSAAWLSNPQSRTVDKTIYRVSEIVVIVTLARLVSWVLFAESFPTIADLRLYLQQPIQFFLAGGFLSTAFIALVAWWFAGSINQVFCQLDVSEEELRYYTLPSQAQKSMADDQPIQIPRQDLQDAYLRYFLGGGMILVILAALSTFEVREFASVSNPFAIARLGLNSVMLIVLLFYFLIGIWLLSHARLLRLNARWLMDGVAIDGAFERNWQRTSLLWLLLVATIAAFLPIGNTLPISRLIGVLVNGVFYFFNLIVSLITYLFGSFVVSLQNAAEDQPAPPPQPYQPPTFTPPPAAADASPIFGMVLSSAFWALLAAVVIGAAIFIARERGHNLGWDRIRTTADQSIAWLRLMWARLRGRLRQAGRSLPDRLRTLRPDTTALKLPDASRWRFVRINGLSPREQIMYFYLSTVKRASEQGVPRGSSETPTEYAGDLKEHWPDTALEVDDLTSAFIEARYSPSDIPPQAADTVKTRWKRLRNRLRNPVKPPDETGSS